MERIALVCIGFVLAGLCSVGRSQRGKARSAGAPHPLTLPLCNTGSVLKRNMN